MRNKIIALTLSALAVSFMSVSAQDYNDDDIYFNPSKAKKKEAPVKKQTTPQRQNNAIIYYPVSDYPSADTYQAPSSGTNISVDDYNRRGIFATVDSVPADSLNADVFANTRRIEKFYNPEVVKGSGDEELVDYYYAQPANVSIVVNTIDPWYTPYYGVGYWGWRNPWAWGPSWSWNYGWGPAYSWN